MRMARIFFTVSVISSFFSPGSQMLSTPISRHSFRIFITLSNTYLILFCNHYVLQFKTAIHSQFIFRPGYLPFNRHYKIAHSQNINTYRSCSLCRWSTVSTSITPHISSIFMSLLKITLWLAVCQLVKSRIIYLNELMHISNTVQLVLTA